MKNLTKLMNCFNKKKTADFSSDVEEVKLLPMNNPKYRFQHQISAEKISSDFFKKLRKEIIERLIKMMNEEEFSLSNIATQKVADELIGRKELIVSLINQRLIEKVSAEQIGSYLKTNNYFSDIEQHIGILFRSLKDYYRGLFLIISIYSEQIIKLGFDSYNFREKFFDDLVRLYIDSSYFKFGFKCNIEEQMRLIARAKVDFNNPILNSKSTLKNIQRLKLGCIIKQLESCDDNALSNIFPKDTLVEHLNNKNNSLGPIADRIENWNYNFTTGICELKSFFNKVLKGKYIDNTWKEFLSVAKDGEGRLKWNGNANSLVQFIFILKRDTKVFENIKSLDAYIIKYFEFTESENLMRLGSSLTYRAALLKDNSYDKGRRNHNDYDILIKMISYLHADCLK